MHRNLRRGLFWAVALAAFAGLAAVLIVAALRRAPPDYEAARVIDSATAARASDEFLQEAAGFASEVRRAGAWDAVFTSEQINGWLAVDVPQNLPDLLPPELSEPRVFIHPGDVTLACRYRSGAVDTVLSFSCDVYLQSANVLALRVKSARAGLVPLPLGKVLDAITHTAQELELPLEWRRAGGDPVALLNVVPPQARGREVIELESVELRDGEIAVNGRTGRLGPVAVASRPQLSDARTSDSASRADNVDAEAPNLEVSPAPSVPVMAPHPTARPTNLRDPAVEAVSIPAATTAANAGLPNRAPDSPEDASDGPRLEVDGGPALTGSSAAGPSSQSPQSPPASSPPGAPLEAAKETLQR